jgi:hypothetical protein
MATGLGWLDAKLGLDTRLEIKTRFVVAQNLDYQVLLGTNSLRPLHGVINYHSKRFKTFQLPTSKEWRSLPLIDPAPQAQNAQAVALASDETVPEYVERIIQELLSQPKHNEPCSWIDKSNEPIDWTRMNNQAIKTRAKQRHHQGFHATRGGGYARARQGRLGGNGWMDKCGRIGSRKSAPTKL